MKPKAKNRKGGLKFFQQHNGDFRWHAKASNGHVVGESGEGYRREGAALNGAVLAALIILREARPEYLIPEQR